MKKSEPFNYLVKLSLLISMISYSVTAYSINYSWNGGTGDWSVMTNWTPNGVPGADDDVIISSVFEKVTIDIAGISVNNITTSNTVLAGADTLSVLGTMNWNGGNIFCPITIKSGGIFNKTSGSGALNNVITIDAGATFNQGVNIAINSGGDMVNNGIYNQSGGRLQLGSSSVTFDNEGTFNVAHDGTALNGSGTFINTGIFNWDVGAGTLTMSCRFTNNGTFNQNTGTGLTIGTLTNNTSLSLLPGTTLQVGACTINAAIDNTVGQTWNFLVNLTYSIPLTIDGIANVNNITGSDPITVNGVMNWNGGDLDCPLTIKSGGIFNKPSSSGSLENLLTIDAGATFNQAVNYSIQSGGNMVNNGTYNQTSGRIQLNNNSVTIDNGGTFNIEHDGTAFAGSGTFHNNGGTLFKTTTTGVTTIGCGVNQDGILAGDGTINFNFIPTIGVNAQFNPGQSPGELTLNMLPSIGTLNIEIEGNVTAGTDFDVLNVTTGTVDLAGGVLNVTLPTGFEPLLGDKYIVLTCPGGCMNNFASTNLPLVPAGWQVNYNETNVELEVIANLPVELIRFNAELIDQQVQLSWQTASEFNNKGFEIERSTDGTNWSNIGWQSGNNTSEHIQQYSFNDHAPKVGSNYYRLKQLDYDGQFEYSSVASIDYKNDSQNITLYPNPVVDQVNIDGWIANRNTKVEIINVSGEVVKSVYATTKTIDVSDLAKGNYFIRWDTGSDSGLTSNMFVKH